MIVFLVYPFIIVSNNIFHDIDDFTIFLKTPFYH